MRFVGWCSPREYVLTAWCFSLTLLGPIRFLRILGFCFDWSKLPSPSSSAAKGEP